MAASMPPSEKPAAPVRERLVAALMKLAGEKPFGDIGISEIAERAGASLAQFREHFPSKGAMLAAYSRAIDIKVLNGTGKDLADEPAKERLFDVLMRRLDAMAPDRAGIDSVMAWARREPLAAAALNQVAVNSMRFMLEAAGIEHEGPLGALKLQGLALAWARVLAVWVRDADDGAAATMAALDSELTRGGQFIARAEDAQRLFAPFNALARALCDTGRNVGERVRERWTPSASSDPSAP